MPDDELQMPFWSHLEELRKRILWSVIWVALGTGICLTYSEKILLVLMWPLNMSVQVVSAFPFVSFVPNQIQQKLHYTTLIEPFWAHLKIGLITGIFLVFPLVMHQVWKFIAPGLLPQERRYAGYFVFFSSLFFLFGLLFCMLFLLPFAVPFLLEYKTENLIAIIKIGDYIDFVLKFLLACGIVFELPLLIVLLSRLGVVSPDWLAKYRKYAFLVSFIFGALLTPTPDIFNQVLISIPIYLLYEVGVLLARFFVRKKKPPSTDLTET